MTISESLKIRELSTTVITAATARELPPGLAQTKPLGFQTVLIQTIADSQSVNAQQNRLRTSEARYTMSGQPRLSASYSDFSKSPAVRPAEPRVFHPAHQVGNITNYSSTNQINDYQGINALSGKNLSEHIELQNRSDHVASVRVNETGPQSRAVAATRSESHEDRMLMSTETTATKSAADMQSEEATSSNDEAAHGKNHDSDPSRHHGDQSGHDGDALSASELPVNKLLSFALDSSCDVSKATLNVAIQSYVGSEHWGREVRQKIVWMFGLGHQSATLTLNPPNLGPLHISVKMQNNVAHTTFRSDDPSVREALAQGLVQLKEMMSKRGLVLGNTSLTNIGDEVLEND